MTAKIRKRDMWKNIPWERRAEIARQIKRMPKSRDKEILRLAFIENLSTADIAELAKQNPELESRNHRPISKRRVLQIIAEYVPDYNHYQKKGKSAERKGHYCFLWSHDKTFCHECGTTENLQWHHKIPLFLGGTEDERNMECVCAECHKELTAYERELFPEHFNPKVAQKAK